MTNRLKATADYNDLRSVMNAHAHQGHFSDLEYGVLWRDNPSIGILGATPPKNCRCFPWGNMKKHLTRSGFFRHYQIPRSKNGEDNAGVCIRPALKQAAVGSGFSSHLFYKESNKGQNLKPYLKGLLADY